MRELKFSYSKSVSSSTYSINIYARNSCGIYENAERLVIVVGVIRDSIKDLLSKTIDEILATYDNLGIAILIDKKTFEIYVVQGPVIYQPIFYTLQGTGVIVSNDMNTIVKLLRNMHGLKTPIDIDVLALFELILFDEIVSIRTIIRGVKNVRAGEYIHITITEKGLRLSHIRYWEPWKREGLYNHLIDRSELQSLVRTLIEMVREYCNVDENVVGVPFSGGLDSSMILALLLKICSDKKIVPVHLNIDNRNELRLSKHICKIYGMKCVYEKYPLTKILEQYEVLLHKHLCCISFPRPSDASLPYSLLAEAFSDVGIRFVMSGDDGDCIWGGYDLPVYYILQLLLKRDFGKLLRFIKTLFLYNRSSLIRFIVATINTFVKTLFPVIYFNRRVKKVIKLNRVNKSFYKLLVQYISTLYENTLKPSSIYTFKEYLARRFMFRSSPLINTNVRAHECHNVVLVPLFASRKLLEMILSLPDELFFTPYGVRSLQRAFLKVAGYPPSIYEQKKSGFPFLILLSPMPK